MVWECIPKEVIVGADLLEFGLFTAVSHFNVGARTVLLILPALKVLPGKYKEEGCMYLDLDHTRGAEYKESTKGRREERH